jgi:hypothetical protein
MLSEDVKLSLGATKPCRPAPWVTGPRCKPRSNGRLSTNFPDFERAGSVIPGIA